MTGKCWKQPKYPIVGYRRQGIYSVVPPLKVRQGEEGSSAGCGLSPGPGNLSSLLGGNMGTERGE